MVTAEDCFHRDTVPKVPQDCSVYSVTYIPMFLLQMCCRQVAVQGVYVPKQVAYVNFCFKVTLPW